LRRPIGLVEIEQLRIKAGELIRSLRTLITRFTGWELKIPRANNRQENMLSAPDSGTEGISVP
jgi:hypothetical protein